MPSTTLPQLQLPDPNGFVNALAAGMKMREVQDAGRRMDLAENRLARKDEAATAKSNALSTYGSSKRTPEDLNALWAASPDAAAGIEKTSATSALATARTATATAQGDRARLEGEKTKQEVMGRYLGAILSNPSRENFNSVIDDMEAKGLGDMSMLRKQVGSTPDEALKSLGEGYAIQWKDKLGIDIKAASADSQSADRAARLDIAQGNAAETVRHHGALENKGSNGLSITGYDEQGRPLIQMGGTPMGKTAQGEVEKKIIDSTEALARINEIEHATKPEMLTYGSKLKDAALDVKSKMGFGMSLGEEKFRGGMADMRQATMRNLNSTIKDQTGQAISPGEVPRIAATIPTMDDAPDVFPIKLKNATRFLRKAIIRAEIARAQGIDPLNSGIDLADDRKIIGLREQQLRQQYRQRAPGMKPDEVDAAIEKQIREELGY